MPGDTNLQNFLDPIAKAWGTPAVPCPPIIKSRGSASAFRFAEKKKRIKKKVTKKQAFLL